MDVSDPISIAADTSRRLQFLTVKRFICDSFRCVARPHCRPTADIKPFPLLAIVIALSNVCKEFVKSINQTMINLGSSRKINTPRQKIQNAKSLDSLMILDKQRIKRQDVLGTIVVNRLEHRQFL